MRISCTILLCALCCHASVLSGCMSSRQGREHVIGDSSPIRESLTLSAQCESLVLALKERYNDGEERLEVAKSLYSTAFAAQNGYLGGLIGIAKANKRLSLGEADFRSSEAHRLLTEFKTAAEAALGPGISPIEWVADAERLASEIENKIDAYNERRIDLAVDNLVSALEQARMASFDTVTAEYLQNKYDDN